MTAVVPAQATSPWGLIVIHYRDPHGVERLLSEADGWTARPTITVVVDNSGDLPEQAEGVHIDRPGMNLGYAGAANRGMHALAARRGDIEAVLICTQDASLEPVAAERLLAALRGDARAAVAAPLLAFSSSPATVFSAGGRLSRNGIGTHPHQGARRGALGAGSVAVDWVDGAVTMLDVSAVDAIGGFDPRYFLYFEELDLQTRLRLAGRSVLLVREAIAFQEPGRFPSYLKYRNGVYFTAKLRGSLRPWPVGRQFLRDVARAVLGQRSFAPLWACRGVIDARRGRMGPPPTRLLDRSPEVSLAA